MKYLLLLTLLWGCINEEPYALTTYGRSYYYINIPNLGTVNCYSEVLLNSIVILEECYLQGSSHDTYVGSIRNASNYLFYKGSE